MHLAWKWQMEKVDTCKYASSRDEKPQTQTFTREITLILDTICVQIKSAFAF